MNDGPKFGIVAVGSFPDGALLIEPPSFDAALRHLIELHGDYRTAKLTFIYEADET